MRSPSREDLPSATIDTIPENDVALEPLGADDDDNDAVRASDERLTRRAHAEDDVMAGGEHPAVGQLPRYSEVMDAQALQAGEPANQRPADPDDTTPMRLCTSGQSATPASDNYDLNTESVPLMTSSPTNHIQGPPQFPNNGNAQADVPAADVTDASHSQQAAVCRQQVPATSSRVARVCRTLTLTCLAVLTLLCVVALVTLETNADLPVLRDLRAIPEVDHFKRMVYEPWKTTVADRLRNLFK